MIYLNGTPVNTTVFPDNTSQVWKLPQEILENKEISRVKWQFSHEGEFMQLAQLKDLLDNNAVPATLELSYLPYGRQDKGINNTATFALHTFSRLLNSLNFLAVFCHDPHSDFGKLAIKNFRPIYPTDQVLSVMSENSIDILCYPDKGAVTKYTEIFKCVPFVYGNKIRDQLTGNILSYELVGDVKDKNVLIVDDICDGGMTFKLLAKELLAASAKSVVLFVSHGIFSKGTRTLLESGISRVFTPDGEMGPRETSIQF